MTRYNQGQVVLIPFPFTNGLSSKKRPAVVVSPDWYNQNRVDNILVAISSVIPHTIDRDQILIQGADVVQSGLLYESVILVGKIFTIESTLILHPLGNLPSNLRISLLRNLQSLFT